MGRQITVELTAIEGTGARVERHTYNHECEITQTTTPMPYAKVHLVDGRTMVAPRYGDDICFDCRNACSPNRWFEMWLDDQGVPYVVG
ncbi:hypothetical protein VPH49_21880 [Pseudomonas luteola]|uniref:hypothetical protein n=1 Tax=Pseudomonas luteola TaxID=47886 RepID=UPI003A884807